MRTKESLSLQGNLRIDTINTDEAYQYLAFNATTMGERYFILFHDIISEATKTASSAISKEFVDYTVERQSLQQLHRNIMEPKEFREWCLQTVQTILNTLPQGFSNLLTSQGLSYETLDIISCIDCIEEHIHEAFEEIQSSTLPIYHQP
jgi:hypothetical protein